ncbi:MAG TPA: hypothetical protein VFZ71_01970, partial [Pyrinomonadaceae bacterium]
MLGLVLLVTLLFPTTAPALLANLAEDEIRIDVPANGQIKVRNDFGSVSVEAWSNSYVAVSATIEGSARFTRSPIVIDNRGTLVSISVVRRPVDPVAAIHLHLKVPKTVEVLNQSGEVLVAREAEAPVATDGPQRKQPELIGANNASRPAGTPAAETEYTELTEGDVIRVDSQLVTLNISVIDRGTNRGLMGLNE